VHLSDNVDVSLKQIPLRYFRKQFQCFCTLISLQNSVFISTAMLSICQCLHIYLCI